MRSSEAARTGKRSPLGGGVGSEMSDSRAEPGPLPGLGTVFPVEGAVVSGLK